MNYYQWKTAKKYGYRRELVFSVLSDSWERFWTCRVRRNHRAKFDSHGACYRCGKTNLDDAIRKHGQRNQP